MAEKSNKKI